MRPRVEKPVLSRGPRRARPHRAQQSGIEARSAAFVTSSTLLESWQALPMTSFGLEGPGAKDYELGQAEGRWWVGGTLQISRVRVCATCQRSLDKLNFSRTQWNKKQVGVSRCRECVFSDLEPDLADALASFRAVD